MHRVLSTAIVALMLALGVGAQTKPEPAAQTAPDAAAIARYGIGALQQTLGAAHR